MLFFTRATQPNVFSSCASNHIFIVLVDNLQFVVLGVGDYEITKNSIFRNHGRHVASSKIDLELILMILLALLSHCFFSKCSSAGQIRTSDLVGSTGDRPLAVRTNSVGTDTPIYLISPPTLSPVIPVWPGNQDNAYIYTYSIAIKRIFCTYNII